MASVRTNLLLSTAVCAVLVPLLIWQLPPEQHDDRWALAGVMLLVGYAAPFIRDFARRGMHTDHAD